MNRIKVLDEDKKLALESVKAVGSNRYYIYLHYRMDTNELIYVGKGCGYRYTTTARRTKRWIAIFNKYGIYAKIYKNNLAFNESGALEIEVIRSIGLSNLVNVSHGGSFGTVSEDNHFYGISLIGKLNGNYGNKYAKNPLSIPVVCLNSNGEFIKEYGSSTEAIQDNFACQTVTACCKNKRKQHKGFIFIYKRDYNPTKVYSIKPSVTDPKKTHCFDLQGNFIKEYPSSQSTAADGYNPKNVQQVCLGQKKTHQSKIFKYV